MTAERRARLLLALGAAAGLALAAVSLAGDPGRSVPGDAIATVNGVPIARGDYLRALGAVATDRREPIDDAVKRRVADRLIDEELLLQHGLDLELPRRDRAVRAALVSGTLELLASSAGAPSDAELRAFYDRHRDYFADAGRIHVRQIFVGVPDGVAEDAARARADEAARRLAAGEPFAQVRDALGDPETAPLPDGPLAATKLREYVGETAVRTAMTLDPGASSAPVRSSMGFHVLTVVGRTPPATPPFEQIADLVRAEMRREADDATLRRALDDLRHAADVRVAGTLP